MVQGAIKKTMDVSLFCFSTCFGGYKKINHILKYLYSVLQLGPLVKQVMPVIETSPVYSVAQSVSGRLCSNVESHFIKICFITSKHKVPCFDY